LPVYVPKYGYTAWACGDFSGWSLSSAGFEPLSSATDGGWIVLEGGNPVKLPALETHYTGPAINRAKFSSISDLPFLGQLNLAGISGKMGAIVNVTPRSDVHMPLSTYPVYSECNGANNAAATFCGTPDMNGGQTFHVVLVNTSQLAKSVSIWDIEYAIDEADICTDGNGDFRITSAELPGLSGLKQGYYALLVLDYRLPNTPCLVAVAPIVVTKSDMTATLIDPALPMPGDSILYTMSMTGATDPGASYMYLAAMVPENNYSAAVNITSDGTLTGTALSMKGFTLSEDISLSPDGKIITVVGKNGTYSFNASDTGSIFNIMGALMSEFNAADVSITNSSITSQTSVDLVLNTKPTMPVGRYVVMSMAIDSSTGKIAAFNQTYVDLGTIQDVQLYTGWNLISLPLRPVNTSLFSVFTPDVMANVTVIWGYNSSNASSPWQYYTTLGYPYIQGNLSEVKETLGYWVLCTNNMTLHVKGAIPATSNVTLNPDWNLVGNPAQPVRNVRDVYTTSFVVWEYSGLDQKYDYWCSAADVPGSVYIQGTLYTLKPTYGYWVLEV
jgi:methanogen extracellular protein (TIGR04279 family)